MKRCPIVGCNSVLVQENPATMFFIGEDCPHRFPEEMVLDLPDQRILDRNMERLEREERRNEPVLRWTEAAGQYQAFTRWPTTIEPPEMNGLRNLIRRIVD